MTVLVVLESTLPFGCPTKYSTTTVSRGGFGIFGGHGGFSHDGYPPSNTTPFSVILTDSKAPGHLQ